MIRLIPKDVAKTAQDFRRDVSLIIFFTLIALFDFVITIAGLSYFSATAPLA